MENENVSCSLCLANFESEPELKDHIKSFHKIKEEPLENFESNEIEKSFQNESQNREIEVEINGKTVRLIPNIKQEETEDNLEYEYESEHSEENVPPNTQIKLQIGGETLHLGIADNTEIKSEPDDEEFDPESLMEDNLPKIEPYIGDKEFICSYCKTMFYNRHNLEAHVLEIHDAILCGFCEKCFKVLLQYEMHKYSEHPEDSKDNNDQSEANDNDSDDEIQEIFNTYDDVTISEDTASNERIDRNNHDEVLDDVNEIRLMNDHDYANQKVLIVYEDDMCQIRREKS